MLRLLFPSCLWIHCCTMAPRQSEVVAMFLGKGLDSCEKASQFAFNGQPSSSPGTRPLKNGSRQQNIFGETHHGDKSNPNNRLVNGFRFFVGRFRSFSRAEKQNSERLPKPHRCWLALFFSFLWLLHWGPIPSRALGTNSSASKDDHPPSRSRRFGCFGCRYCLSKWC